MHALTSPSIDVHLAHEGKGHTIVLLGKALDVRVGAGLLGAKLCVATSTRHTTAGRRCQALPHGTGGVRGCPSHATHLVAREAEHHEALAAVLVVQALQLCVLWCEAAGTCTHTTRHTSAHAVVRFHHTLAEYKLLTGQVDHQADLALELAQGSVLAVNVLRSAGSSTQSHACTVHHRSALLWLPVCGLTLTLKLKKPSVFVAALEPNRALHCTVLAREAAAGVAAEAMVRCSCILSGGRVRRCRVCVGFGLRATATLYPLALFLLSFLSTSHCVAGKPPI